MTYTVVCELGRMQQGAWGKVTPKYGIRGDSTSLVILSCERLSHVKD